jgi:hypothetical protein
MGMACSTNWGKRNAYRIFVGSERPLGTQTRRWADNIKIDLREIRRGGMEWIDLAQDWLQ